MPADVCAANVGCVCVRSCNRNRVRVFIYIARQLCVMCMAHGSEDLLREICSVGRNSLGTKRAHWHGTLNCCNFLHEHSRACRNTWIWTAVAFRSCTNCTLATPASVLNVSAKDSDAWCCWSARSYWSYPSGLALLSWLISLTSSIHPQIQTFHHVVHQLSERRLQLLGI